MDELQISGKRFISSRRLAREHGYTADYLGQLIRGGKVTGQKVGRAWYVDAASFAAYLGGESSTANAVEVEQEAVVETVEAPEVVAAPVVAEEIAEEAEESVQEAEEHVQEPETKEEIIEEAEPAVASPIVVAEKEEELVYHVPLHIVKKEEPVEEKKEEVSVSGLKYFADNEPGFPEIRSTERKSRIAEPVQAQEVAAGKGVASERHRAPNNFRMLALSGAAVAVFVLSAVVSSAMTVNLSIEAGNSASTSYSISW